MSTQLAADPDDENEPVIINTTSFSAVSNSQDSSVDLFPPNNNSKSNEKPWRSSTPMFITTDLST